MTPVAPLRRLARLARKGSAQAVGSTVLVAAQRELACRRTVRALRRSSGKTTPVVVGPFVGEVGFELLYWIPMLRRLLTESRIEPRRVVAYTRGGAAAWYRDFAARSVEIFDVMSPDEFVTELHRQRDAAGHARQLRVGDLDRELLRRLGPLVGPATVVHPRLAYTRLRHIWDGLEPVSNLQEHTRHAPLERSTEYAGALGLPAHYVAVKAYFSESFPDTAGNRGFLRDLLERLAEITEVVLILTSPQLDDHVQWAEAAPSVYKIDNIEPRSNLAVQTEIVAGSSALVCTYGGFSYLGALAGVPTHAFYSADRFSRIHLEAMWRSLAPQAYGLFRVGDERALGALLGTIRPSPYEGQRVESPLSRP